MGAVVPPPVGMFAAPATITPVAMASSSSSRSIWDDLSGRGVQLGEDFLRKLLGLGGGSMAPPGSAADIDLILAQQRASQQRTILLVGGGLAAVVLLVVLLKK